MKQALRFLIFCSFFISVQSNFSTQMENKNTNTKFTNVKNKTESTHRYNFEQGIPWSADKDNKPGKKLLYGYTAIATKGYGDLVEHLKRLQEKKPEEKTTSKEEKQTPKRKFTLHDSKDEHTNIKMINPTHYFNQLQDFYSKHILGAKDYNVLKIDQGKTIVDNYNEKVSDKYSYNEEEYIISKKKKELKEREELNKSCLENKEDIRKYEESNEKPILTEEDKLFIKKATKKANKLCKKLTLQNVTIDKNSYGALGAHYIQAIHSIKFHKVASLNFQSKETGTSYLVGPAYGCGLSLVAQKNPTYKVEEKNSRICVKQIKIWDYKKLNEKRNKMFVELSLKSTKDRLFVFSKDYKEEEIGKILLYARANKKSSLDETDDNHNDKDDKKYYFRMMDYKKDTFLMPYINYHAEDTYQDITRHTGGMINMHVKHIFTANNVGIQFKNNSPFKKNNTFKKNSTLQDNIITKYGGGKELIFNHPFYIAMYNQEQLENIIGEYAYCDGVENDSEYEEDSSNDYEEDENEIEDDDSRCDTYNKKVLNNPFNYAASIVLVMLPPVIDNILKKN